MTTLFLHPIGLDGHTWHWLAPELLEDAITYDLPWHGGRPKPAGEVSIAAFADDVAGNTAGHLNVVGVSMGGAVAQELALRHPERVASLLLACSTAGGRGGQVQRERALRTEEVGMAGMVEPTLERWFTPAALDAPAHPGVAYVRERLLRDDPRSFAAGWRALAMHDTLDRLSAIRVPTTVLHATEDAGHSQEAKAAMVARLPRGRYVEVAGPHMIQVERPPEFGAALTDHLAWAGEQEL